MKRFISMLLIGFTTILFADQIDVTVSEGTDQSVIEALIPKPANPEVDANISIQAIFTDPLNPMMTMHSVTLHKLGGDKQKGFFIFIFGGSKNKKISGQTSYDQSTYTITFTPDNPLEVGFYEVSFKHLMAMKPGRDMRIKAIKYRFYVPEVINGFKLPPEPDEDKNNETLLGIDFNRNGIRDDVERLIIIEEAKNNEFPKTQTAISLQYAQAWQKMIETPTLETRKYLEKASACQWYFFNKNTKNISGYRKGRLWRKNHVSILGVKIEDAIFNTKERILRRFEFNRACSGHIFEAKTPSVENCMINIDTLGE
jgi:hypothetical protein